MEGKWPTKNDLKSKLRFSLKRPFIRVIFLKLFPISTHYRGKHFWAKKISSKILIFEKNHFITAVSVPERVHLTPWISTKSLSSSLFPGQLFSPEVKIWQLLTLFTCLRYKVTLASSLELDSEEALYGLIIQSEKFLEYLLFQRLYINCY